MSTYFRIRHFFLFFSRKICKHHNSHRNFAAQFRKAPGATKESDNNSRFSETSRCGGIEEQLRRIRGNEKAPNVTQHPLNLNLIPNAKTGSMNLNTVLNGIQMVHEKIIRGALRKTLWLVLNLSMSSRASRVSMAAAPTTTSLPTPVQTASTSRST